MDSQRSLLVLGVGAAVVLAVLVGLLPVLLQGFQPRTVQGLVEDRTILETLDQEAQRSARPPPRRRVRRALPPRVIREDFVPRNLTERQWAEAMARMKALEAEQDAHQEKVEAFTAFMESSTGGNVSAAFELVRRGKPQDAAALLEGLLPELAEQPPEVQEPLLLASVRLFKEAGRQDLMAQTLHEYLRLVEERLTQGGLDGRTKRAQSELLEQVQTLLADARVAAGGRL